MSKESRKGATFEKQVADYLRDRTGLDVDRRIKHGAKDTGDISGVFLGGRRVVIECKNQQQMKLAAWTDEAKREAANDNAPYWFVIHKRKGKGVENMGETYVTTTLEQLAEMMLYFEV